jgi:2-keto-4-pentenoate hydratase/2-oxohepta-3-ene-1,7-dioic acid hydratase in catechol pathway
MKLLTIDDTRGGSPGALLSWGESLHLSRAALPGTIEAWLPASLAEMLAGGGEALRVAGGIVSRAERASPSTRETWRRNGVLLASPRLLAPIPAPRLIVAAGLAYKAHLAEMSNTPTPPHPTAFMKSPTSLSGPDEQILIPPQASAAVDYEGELACVFGKRCHNVSADEALSYLAGYTVANDFSARDWAGSVWAAKEPWEARITWEVNIMGKQLPGFTALGPVLTTIDEIPDPAELKLTTRVNGATMQSTLVSDLIFPIAETIAYLSRWYTFTPGDVLLTGTPSGVGIGRRPPVFMHEGDTVEVEIDRIGTLCNRFQALHPQA